MDINRDYYFDNLKVILIFLIVLGHTIEPLTSVSFILEYIYKFIYFFHIPLFVFITGYFSKKLNFKLSKYLAPYIIFEILYTISYNYVYGFDGAFSLFSPSWIMWYLFSVICWKMILPFYIKLKYPILISFALAILIGYAKENIFYYFSLMRSFIFFPFFLLGYYFKREYLSYLQTIKIKVLSIIVLIISFYTISNLSPIIPRTILFGTHSYEQAGFLEWYSGLYRILIYLVAIVLSISILSLVPHKKIIISSFGTRTLNVYLLHGFIIMALIHFNIYAYIHTPIEKLLIILLAIVVTVLLSTKWVERLFNWLVQPKINFLFKKE